ncbi:MAG: TIGR04283 family arsenosugar biosynthesis glycosyltransferase [Pseudomonadota bacterium]
MRARLSVVIPTLMAEDALRQSLPALSEGLHSGLVRELIISDGGSRDATQQIAEAAGARMVTGVASRGGQLRRGAELAEGDWLLFLHADCVLPAGWAQAVTRHLESEGAAAFRLGYDVDGLAPALVSGWANLRSRMFGLPYGDQALLIEREVYDTVGGYADIPLMEDVAMARALRGQITLLPLTVLTSSEKYRREGWLKRGARNLLCLARFLMGADPQTLAKRYDQVGGSAPQNQGL